MRSLPSACTGAGSTGSSGVRSGTKRSRSGDHHLVCAIFPSLFVWYGGVEGVSRGAFRLGRSGNLWHSHYIAEPTGTVRLRVECLVQSHDMGEYLCPLHR